MDNAEKQKGGAINSLLRGSGINFIGLIFRFCFVFLQSLLAVRFYGTEQFGLYIVFVSAVNLLSYIGQLGFSRTLVRYVALYIAREERQNIARILQFTLVLTLSVSCLIGILLNYSASNIALFFGNAGLERSFFILGLAIPLFTLTTLLGAFTQGFGDMQYKVLAIDIIAPIVEVVLLFLFLQIGLADSGLVLAYTISFAVACILLTFFAYRFLAQIRTTRLEAAARTASIDVRSILQFTLPTWFGLLLRNAIRPVNVLVIGAVGTASMVGIYSVLERLVAVGVIVLMSINAILAPIVADLVERQKHEELSRIYTLTVRWSLAVCIPIFIVFGIFGKQILALFGPEFVSSSSALWYLAAAWVFSLLIGPADVVLMMSGRPQYSAINQVLMLSIVVGAGWLLIPQFGVFGAVWSFALGTIIVNIFRFAQVWYQLQIHPFGLSVAKTLTAGLGMLMGLGGWSIFTGNSLPLEWPQISIMIAISTLLYGIILVAMRLEDEEIHAFHNARKRLQIRYA